MDYLRQILLFVPLLAYFFYELLVFESQCSAQTVSLLTGSNDILLAGEHIVIICTVSNLSKGDDITMVITDETGQNIATGSIGPIVATGTTAALSTSLEISTNQTLFCSVTWVDFTASTNLTISPLPIEQTYCTSNYTDGIIAGQTVTLTCYSSTSVVGSISWSFDSDIPFDEMKGLVRTMTSYNSINVAPTFSQSGTVLTCERDGVTPVTDIDRCSVGPINVYEELIIFIDPIVTTNDPAILYPGQTKHYVCTSLPTSSVQWSIPKKLNDSGIELSVVGSKIAVTVPSDSNFTGVVDLFCSGHILDQTAVANITFVIRPMESVSLPTLVSSPEKSAPTTSASNTVSSKPPGNSFLVVSLVTVIGFLLFTLTIMFVLLYRKSRHTESNSKSVANVTSSANVGYDYCDIDTGGVTRTVTSNTEATPVSESSPNSKEQYSRVIINESESVAYEIPDAQMGNDYPSKKTNIDEEGNESENYENPQKLNFETNGQK